MRTLRVPGDEARSSVWMESLLLLTMVSCASALDGYYQSSSPPPMATPDRTHNLRGPRWSKSPAINQSPQPRPTPSFANHTAGLRLTTPRREPASVSLPPRATTTRPHQQASQRSTTSGKEEGSGKTSAWRSRVDGWVIAGLIMCSMLLVLILIFCCVFQRKKRGAGCCCQGAGSEGLAGLQSYHVSEGTCAGQNGDSCNAVNGRQSTACSTVLNTGADLSAASMELGTQCAAATHASSILHGPPSYFSLQQTEARPSRPSSTADLQLNVCGHSARDADANPEGQPAPRVQVHASPSLSSLPDYSDDMVLSHPPA